MLERQVFIYDKRREVIDRHKPIWWDIWNAPLQAMTRHARSDRPHGKPRLAR
jgi:hypothetical protein